MPFGHIDVSYRGADPVPAFILPRSPDLVQKLLDESEYSCVRFSMNVRGFFWVADAGLALHGDEFSGEIVAEGPSASSWIEAARETRVACGTITAYSTCWGVKLWDLAQIPVIKERGESWRAFRNILTAYSTWEEATRGVELAWIDSMDFDERHALVRR